MKSSHTAPLRSRSLRHEKAKIRVEKEFKWIQTLSILRDKRQRINSQLTNFITDLICSNALSPGDRLPPIKPFADALGIHHETVAAVYRQLDRQKLVRIEPRRGTYVNGCKDKCLKDLRKSLEQPPAFLFKDSNKANHGMGKNSLAWLEIGDKFPGSDDLMDEKYAVACRDAIRYFNTKHAGNNTQETSLKESLVKLIEGRGMLVDGSQILFTRHDKSIASEMFRNLLFKEDWAVMVSPADAKYYQDLQNITSNIAFTGADDEGMSTAQLEHICRKKKVKLVVVRSSADYQRAVALSKQRREHLLALAEQYNFVIIEIDDYPDSFYGKTNFPLIGKSKSPRVIYISSVSIVLCKLENFKVVIGPGGFIARLKLFQDLFDSEIDKILQRALITILTSSALHELVRKLNSKCKKSMDDVVEMVKFFEGFLPCCQPSAGFSLWIEFKAPAPGELVESVFAAEGIVTRRKGSLQAATVKGIKVNLGSGVPQGLEHALSELSMKLCAHYLTLETLSSL